MSISSHERSSLGTEKEVFSFTLVLDGVNEITDDLERAMGEAGCDDALLSVLKGTVRLDFDRAAESMVQGILSAIHAVESCGLPIRVREVLPPGHHAFSVVNAFLQVRGEQPVLDELRAELSRKLPRTGRTSD